VLTWLAEIGGDFYYHLFRYNFCPPDNDILCKVVETVDSFDAGTEPLTIVVFTQDLFVPWQLLHPTVDADARRFWGFRYALSVMSLSSDDPEGSSGGKQGADTIQPPTAKNFLYAHYAVADHATSSDKAIMLFSHRLLEKVNADLTPESPSEVDSAEKFLGALRDHSDDFSLIWTYGHGSSGSDLTKTLSDELSPTSTARGAELIFGATKADTVSLDGLQHAVFNHQGLPLVQRPIVVLSGCETGTNGFGRSSSDSLPRVFMHLGARAVVATEAPIWDEFGYAFSADLFHLLLTGSSIGDALMQTRHRYFEEHHNPFGLLYNLYGDPNVHIAASPRAP